MQQFAELTSFNAVYKLKLFTVKESGSDAEYLGIFDRTSGLIVCTLDN